MLARTCERPAIGARITGVGMAARRASGRRSAALPPWRRAAAPIEPRPGDVMAGKYVLGRCIGAGGMGAVFQAEHPALARRVAIKVLRPHLAAHPLYVQRFRNEAVAASRVRHRGALRVIDFDVAMGSVPFLAMELVPGRPLGQRLAEELLPLGRSLAIIDRILDVLDAAHGCAVVHADVKSDNFMLDEAAGDAVTLIDFGLAHLDGAATEPGFLAGTPEYVAPEFIRGAAPTPASDLYGAGVILYELLTGVTPFDGASAEEILQRQLAEPAAPPSRRRPDRAIPAEVDRIVLRALAKDPAARFASARDFRDALGAAAAPRARSLGAAIRELEDGLAADGRLAGALAALYELAGVPDEARRVLAAAAGRAAPAAPAG